MCQYGVQREEPRLLAIYEIRILDCIVTCMGRVQVAISSREVALIQGGLAKQVSLEIITIVTQGTIACSTTELRR